MANLKRVGTKWSADIDGPFHGRVQTNCPEINALLEASARQRVAATEAIMRVVLQETHKLHHTKRKKIEAAVIATVAELSGRAWQFGVSAAKEQYGFQRSDQPAAERNKRIFDFVEACRQREAKTLAEAFWTATEAVDDDGQLLFTNRDDGETPLSVEAVKSAYYAAKKAKPK